MVDTKRLRAEAERCLAAQATAFTRLATTDPEKLIHELNVQQIELEMQNEHLKKLQIELEHTRDRYIDLFDYAPVGYLSLDLDGIIVDANLTASLMLGVTHGNLQTQALASFVSEDDGEHWHLNLRQLRFGAYRRSCCLKMLGAGNTAIYMRLHLSQVISGIEAPIRIALIDISEREYLAQSSHPSQSAA